MQVFELLSAVALYSKEGRELVLDALNYYKVSKVCLQLDFCLQLAVIYQVVRWWMSDKYEPNACRG